MIEKLELIGVYWEKALNLFCYKYQFPGQNVIMVKDTDKERAAKWFFIEFLKSLHYSLKWLYEEKRPDELRALIEKMRGFNDVNINKTIEIFERHFVKIP